MKKRNILTFVIIAAVIIITFFVLRHSADVPATIPNDNTDVSEHSGYIGLSSDDAIELAQSNGEVFRIVNIDGEPQPVTMDYRPGRINASTVDGVVTEYSVEGEIGTTETKKGVKDYSLSDFRVVNLVHDSENYRDIIFAVRRNDWIDYSCSGTSNESCYIFVEPYENVGIKSELNFVGEYRGDVCSGIDSKTILQIVDINTINIKQDEHLKGSDGPCQDSEYPKVIDLSLVKNSK